MSKDSPTGGWHVVLLVDSQERNHPGIQFMPHHEIVRDINQHFDRYSGGTSCSDVHCETRSLKTGDYLWVARKERKDKVLEERVLDCIIERKTFNDLCVTLIGKSTTYEPLTRMEIQMKKLKASTISQKLFLLEKSKQTRSQFRTDYATMAGRHFLTQLGKKKVYKEIQLCYSNDVTGTVQFLIDRHELMRDRVRQAYQKSLLNRAGDPDEALGKLPPFAPIQTLVRMNKAIQADLDDPEFHYYLRLRRMGGLADHKANIIMKTFPTETDLKYWLYSTPRQYAILELAKLPEMGKILATKLCQLFSQRKPAVVTPPSKAISCKRARPRTTVSNADQPAKVSRTDEICTQAMASVEIPQPVEDERKPPAKKTLTIDLLDSDSSEDEVSATTTASRQLRFGGGSQSVRRAQQEAADSNDHTSARKADSLNQTNLDSSDSSTDDSSDLHLTKKEEQPKFRAAGVAFGKKRYIGRDPPPQDFIELSSDEEDDETKEGSRTSRSLHF